MYPVFHTRGMGSSFTPPEAIRRLPVSMLRTALPTRDPSAAADGMTQFRAAMQTQDFRPALVLPQGLALEMHKRAPGGISRGEFRPATSGAMGVAQVMRQSGSALRELRGVGVPRVEMTLEQAAAARGANQMTQPMVGTRPKEPVRTRTRPIVQPINAPMEAYGTATMRMEAEAASFKAADSGRAMREVAELRAAYARFYGQQR